MVGFVMSIKGQYNVTVAFHDGDGEGGSWVTRFRTGGRSVSQSEHHLGGEIDSH